MELNRIIERDDIRTIVNPVNIAIPIIQSLRVRVSSRWVTWIFSIIPCSSCSVMVLVLFC